MTDPWDWHIGQHFQQKSTTHVVRTCTAHGIRHGKKMAPPKGGTGKLHLAHLHLPSFPLKVSGLSKIKALHWHIFSSRKTSDILLLLSLKRDWDLYFVGLWIFFGWSVLRFRFRRIYSILNLCKYFYDFFHSFCLVQKWWYSTGVPTVGLYRVGFHDPSEPKKSPNRWDGLGPSDVWELHAALQHVFLGPHFVRDTRALALSPVWGNYLRMIIHPNNVVREK